MAWYDFLRKKPVAAAADEPDRLGGRLPSSEAAQIIQVFNRHAEESRRRHEELRTLVMDQAKQNEALRSVVIDQSSKIQALGHEVSSLRERISKDTANQSQVNEAVHRRLRILDGDIARVDRRVPMHPADGRPSERPVPQP
jgi:predicted RNase H-like nuclease (RuvC/YqgF family)